MRQCQSTGTCQVVTTADRDRRRNTRLNGFGLLEDGTTFRLSIVDLSYDGCKVETAIGLMPGLNLKLSIPGLGSALNATVCWSKDDKAGLRFIAQAASIPEQRPRIHDRIEIRAEVTLRRLGRINYRCRMFDVTPGGCKVEFIERPRRGEVVWIKFEGLDAIEANVRWIDGYIGGLQFVRSVYPAVFDLLLMRLKRYG